MTVFRLLDTALGDRNVQIPTPPLGATTLPGVPATVPAMPVLEAIVGVVSSDPGSGQDSTQGYVAGSKVFNNTANQLRFWVCRDATAGAGKWSFEGADYANGGTNPNIEITQFGGAPTAAMAEEGNINRQISTAGVQPASTGADIVLAVYTLPAGAFDQAGRGLNIQANGSTVANTNAKRIKIIAGATTAVVGSAVVGGTTIADSGTINTAAQGGGYCLAANVFKAAAANSQLAIHESAQLGNFVAPLLAPAALTLTESGAIIIAVTGNATTATTDITNNFLEVNAMN